MDLSKIYSISGKSGLFKLIAKSKNGVIVESLQDQKRLPVFASQRIICLDDITVFKNDGDIKLKEVFRNIFNKENTNPITIDFKDDKACRSYFEEILPDYDTERVHLSDMRKIFAWYNQLHAKGLVEFTEEETAAPSEEETSKAEESDKEAIAEQNSEAVAEQNTEVVETSEAEGSKEKDTAKKVKSSKKKEAAEGEDGSETKPKTKSKKTTKESDEEKPKPKKATAKKKSE